MFSGRNCYPGLVNVFIDLFLQIISMLRVLLQFGIDHAIVGDTTPHNSPASEFLILKGAEKALGNS